MKNNAIKKRSILTGSVIAVAAAILSFTAPAAKAQAPGIVGIDHVGINVPDLDQGVKFFHDMFGFNKVTQLGPFPMDASWKKTFKIHDDAGEVTIQMMRAGDGSNIEVFGYKPGKGSDIQPFRDDLSATHFALYTTDIKASKAYLESKGVKFVSDIMSGGGDTEGESWVYLETPWGSTIELNSYPKGKGYEKNHPAVKLWNASAAIAIDESSLGAAELEGLKNKQMAVFNELNPASRLIKMKAIYQDRVYFSDHEGIVNGLEPLNARITELQQKNANFKFTPIKIDNVGNRVRIFWNYGPAANPKLIEGMDLIILEDGKIRSLDTFLDRFPKSIMKK
jgi:catechol 2,3-dioxygenase-like lactoylglutathione lyase family enzyme